MRDDTDMNAGSGGSRHADEGLWLKIRRKVHRPLHRGLTPTQQPRIQLARDGKRENDALCERCSQIPFDPTRNPPILEHRAGKNEWNLGTFEAVCSRTSCPLCRLARSLVESSDDPSHHQKSSPITFKYNGDWFDVAGTYHGKIYAVHEAELGASQFRLGVARTQMVDLTKLKHYISFCDTHHAECREITGNSKDKSAPGLSSLRLVDVVHRNIVEVDLPCDYITLSYVWGGILNFRLTTANRKALSEPGSITKIWSHLPRTIRDAIELVDGLGERYLWVDSLCLVQNDEVDLTQGIGVMDLIYETAKVTVVAASGSHADAGLPGVGCTARPMAQLIERIKPGLSLAIHFTISQLLSRTAYSRRAWTFQEQSLSRRAIYVFDHDVYFQCRRCVYSESLLDPGTMSTVLGHPRDHANWTADFFSSVNLHTLLNDDPRSAYSEALRKYTPRALSSQDDAMLPMAGIMRRVSQRIGCNFFQGMPLTGFELFLCFFNQSEAHTLRRRRSFPSYSWAGWIGPLAFRWLRKDNIEHWVWESTWIQWYQRGPDTSPQPLGDYHASHASESSCLSSAGHVAGPSFGDRLPLDSTRTNATERLAHASSFIKFRYPVLQFWTVSAYYTLGDFDPFETSIDLYGRNGKKCGDVYIDGFEDDDFLRPGGKYEFILICNSDFKVCQLCDDKDPRWLRRRSKYCALLLQWGSEIAERKGLAYICAASIEESHAPGPCWKEILLA